jgi:GT2 family glycosyltransferase
MQLKGFDESYVVGDFEDSDLCLRVKREGKLCAVDHDVHLYHLERKSQENASESWRRNLTLYNAWVHQRRWFDAVKSLPVRRPGRV